MSKKGFEVPSKWLGEDSVGGVWVGWMEWWGWYLKLENCYVDRLVRP